MSRKDEPLVPGKKDIIAKMEDIKELYRDADLAYRGFSEPGDGVDEFSGKDAVEGAEPAAAAMRGEVAPPRWVLEVIADMAVLAKTEGWADLHALLEEARTNAAEVIDEMTLVIDRLSQKGGKD